jgi:hypothetical protein
LFAELARRGPALRPKIADQACKESQRRSTNRLRDDDSHSRSPAMHRYLFLLPAALLSCASSALAANTCTAQSTAQVPNVVELYTSEGCSSCPPADRWLSTLKGRVDVLALGFHVTYWDQLGWPDRFATPATTQRQHRWREAHKGPYVYTPQIVLDGRDMRDWSSLRSGVLPKPKMSATATIKLDAQDGVVRASVANAAADKPLAGYWVVLEDGISSRVKAGENSGSTLTHDHVVVHYQPVAAWAAGAPLQSTLALPAALKPLGARRVAFVLTQGDGLQAVQAAVLSC